MYCNMYNESQIMVKKKRPNYFYVIFFLQNKVQVKEVKFKKDYLNDEDVFLIDLGLQIYQVHSIPHICFVMHQENMN